MGPPFVLGSVSFRAQKLRVQWPEAGLHTHPLLHHPHHRPGGKFVAGKQFDEILTKERVGKILEGGWSVKF